MLIHHRAIDTSVQQRSVKNIRCDSEFHARERSTGKVIKELLHSREVQNYYVRPEEDLEQEE